MSFESAKDINTEDGISVLVKTIEIDNAFSVSFFMSLPERDEIDIAEFRALVEGLGSARQKLQSMIEIMEQDDFDEN